MSWLSLGELARMAEGRLHGISPAAADRLAIERAVRDSRQVAEGDLFLALRGERFDGHDFVADVTGTVSAAMVERELPLPLPQVVVDDVRLAMGRLALAWRQRYAGPVVALTGSSGKTTLKEMIAAILSRQGLTHATRGNLNNDLGVPLTLFELRPEHAFAVIEMHSVLRPASGDIRMKGRFDTAGVHFRPENTVDVTNTEYFFHADGIDPGRDVDLPWVAETIVMGRNRYSVIMLNHPTNPMGTHFLANHDSGQLGACPTLNISTGKSGSLRYQWIFTGGKVLPKDVIEKATREFADR